MELYCCGCGAKVEVRLTDGSEIYPHRKDLHELPFWKCDKCNNYVGCHYKTKNRTRPLGCIPTQELKDARKHIHKIVDPIWKNGEISRKKLYAKLSESLGWKYHTAKIRSIQEAKEIYRLIKKIQSPTPY